MDKKVTNEINKSELHNDLKNKNTEKDMKNLITEVNKDKPKKKQRKKEERKERKEKNQFIEELEFLRNIYINQFIEESIKRNDMNAKNFIPMHTKDFKEKVGLIIKKADEEFNSYKQKLESIELKNSELQRNKYSRKSQKYFI